LAKRFGHKITFAFVYIAEAHASDEWPVGHSEQIRQPRNTPNRLEVARERLADLGVGDEFLCLVDSVEGNYFHETYAVWPFRWFIVDGNNKKERNILSIAQPRSSGYDVKELVAWIVNEATKRKERK